MAKVTEGDHTPCVYCKGGVVTIHAIQEDEADPAVVRFAEGNCAGCGRLVIYDYDPVAHPPTLDHGHTD